MHRLFIHMNLLETKAISIGSYDKELWVRHVPDYFLSNKPPLPFQCRFQPDIFSLGKVQLLARYVQFLFADVTLISTEKCMFLLRL